MAEIIESLQRFPDKKRPERIYSRTTVEQSFLESFEVIGGVQRLAQWANTEENYGTFLQMLLKFAPKEVLTPHEGNIIEWKSNIPQSPLNGPVDG